MIAGDRLGSCAEVIQIYRQRADHLAKFETDHARTLRRDVLVFVGNLEASRQDQFRLWAFSMPDGVTFHFVEQHPSGRLLGCLRTVSKLAVSNADWQELWGDARKL